MKVPWTPAGLLERLAARARHPAIIDFDESGSRTTDSGVLAAEATRFAQALQTAGFGAGKRIALSGPSGTEWIIVALGVLASGAILVPIDDLADDAEFTAALTSSRADLLVAASARLEMIARAAAPGPRTLRLEPGVAGSWTKLAPPWQSSPAAPALAAPEPATMLLLSWTSGTTGSPRIFPLTVGNIAANVEAIEAERLVSEADRVLLPLPPHHAYPLIVGMLSMLTIGATLILPAAAAGPEILRALREGEATAIIGVPRLYEAILLALDARFAAHGWLATAAWRAAQAAAGTLHRGGLAAGRVLFFPLRRRLAPRLRLMVSGGARVEPVTEERLEALGWTVLGGYGLAETASMFTGNLPRARRLGSAGKPLGEGQVRIADADPEGIGEVQLRGPVVTPGYLDNPAANADSFTADGWFRTGDLGRLDADGFLFITGRAREILVLGDGKKVDPEPLERLYGAVPGIAEIGLLVAAGKLVALVRPDVAVLRERRVVSVRQAVHVALGECAETLPSYKRLAGFAFTEAPLPRTRLGKVRRFLLPPLYADAEAGKTRRAAQRFSDEDRALLGDPRAAATWTLFQQRFPDRAIDLDVNLALELNLDSFGRMELAVALQERLGAGLSQEEVAGAATIRDLVRCAAGQAMAPGTSPLPTLALDLDRWLSPTGLALTIAGAGLFALNRLLMRLAFRLEADGLERLPARGGFVITPNHVSDLDPLAVAGALPFPLARRLYWSGDIVRLFSSAPARLFCRMAHIFPTDEAHAGAAVAAAARVLAAGNVQVWFPEGWRSPDGSAGRFMPGIGQLLLRTDVPAVPVWIDGAFAALPRSRRLPRLCRIRVIFGDPVAATKLREEGEGASDGERIADGLRRRVMRLAP